MPASFTKCPQGLAVSPHRARLDAFGTPAQIAGDERDAARALFECLWQCDQVAFARPVTGEQP